MSAPVHRDELLELEAARKAAYACLDHYSRIVDETRILVRHHLSAPVIDKYLCESFGLPWPPRDDQIPSDLLELVQQTPAELLKLIHNLIEVLNWGWDAICQADGILLLVTSGPVSAAGVTSTSTCRLAGELAISLWNTIRYTDLQLDPNLDAREPDAHSGSPHLRYTHISRADEKGLLTPDRFDLREELFQALEESFMKGLIHKPQIHAQRLRARVEIEIARGRDLVRTRRVAGFDAETSAERLVCPPEALGPTASQERRHGQALRPDEEREYRRIIKVAKGLKLKHRRSGNYAKIAAAARVDVRLVRKAIKWGRKHELIRS
jgi:hypothetical protein